MPGILTNGQSILTSGRSILTLGEKVAVLPTLWVAGGGGINDGELAFSVDGDTWVSASVNPMSGVSRVDALATDGMTKYLAGGQDGYIMSSTDGDTWSVVTTNPFGTSPTDDVRGIAYGGGIWIAVGPSDGSIISRSTDGITWTPVVTGNDFSGEQTANAVTYGNGRFHVIFNSGNILYSDDGGLTWTPLNQGASPGSGLPNTNLNNSAYSTAADVWVVTSNSIAGNPWRSTDGGLTFSGTSIGSPALFGGSFSVATDGTGNWIIARQNVPSNPGRVMKSVDEGLNWDTRNPAALGSGFGRAIATDGSRWVASTTGDGINGEFAYSDDVGDTWTSTATNPISIVNEIITSNGLPF